MVSQYRKLAESLYSEEWISSIRDFYIEEFRDPEFPSLKFRYIKFYGYDSIKKTYMWFYLHRVLNRRSFLQGSLKKSLIQVISKGIVPIRLFFSAAEWSYPYLIRGLKSRRTRYLSPGIVPIESDVSLEVSHEVARVLAGALHGDKKFVFSGNKSIHVWLYNFDSGSSWDISSIETVEEDLEFRRYVFDVAQSLVPHELDRRTTEDTYRVLPVIGSLNGFTMGRVTEIPEEEL